MTAEKKFVDVACAACGCVCDDLAVTVADGKVVRVEPACPKADAWFRATSVADAAFLKDKPVALAAAVNAAADLLRAAKAPLILGSIGCVEGYRSAIALADRLGAVIDPGGSSAATIAFQQVGKSTCTLGEVRERVDLVIVWGGDPAVSHSRLLQRYTSEARTLIVIDDEISATSRIAEVHLRPQLGADYEILGAVRGLLAGLEPKLSVGGLSPAELQNLFERMRDCNSGIIFFGPKITHGSVAHATVSALYSLARELNAVKRFYVLELRDECSAEATATWQTGYSGGVSFVRGFPCESSADAVLARGEADCCVILNAAAANDLSADSQQNLAKLPKIGLNSPGAVRFNTATYGLHAPGTAYRLDDVPIPLRAVLPTNLPTAANILDRIHAAL